MSGNRVWRASSSAAIQTITFYPVTADAASFAPPPEPINKAIPAWWRSHEVFEGNNRKISGGSLASTVKKCPSILDVLGTGYLLRVPVDIWVDTSGDRIRWQLPKGNASWKTVGIHPAGQVRDLPFDRTRYCDDVFRIHPLWAFKTPPGYSCLVTHPHMEYEVPWQALPGIIDTDQYAPDGAYSVLIQRGFSGVIKQGTPLLQVMPFRREDWAMNVEREFSPDLIDGQGLKLRSMFQGAYRRKFWARKSYT